MDVLEILVAIVCPHRAAEDSVQRDDSIFWQTKMADGLFEENCARAAVPTLKDRTASMVEYCRRSDSLDRTRSNESATTSGAQNVVAATLKHR